MLGIYEQSYQVFWTFVINYTRPTPFATITQTYTDLQYLFLF